MYFLFTNIVQTVTEVESNYCSMLLSSYFVCICGVLCCFGDNESPSKYNRSAFCIVYKYTAVVETNWIITISNYDYYNIETGKWG